MNLHFVRFTFGTFLKRFFLPSLECFPFFGSQETIWSKRRWSGIRILHDPFLREYKYRLKCWRFVPRYKLGAESGRNHIINIPFSWMVHKLGQKKTLYIFSLVLVSPDIGFMSMDALPLNIHKFLILRTAWGDASLVHMSYESITGTPLTKVRSLWSFMIIMSLLQIISPNKIDPFSLGRLFFHYRPHDIL